MSQIQGGISRTSPTTELELIQQKKSALQKLVKLTGMLHQLNQGLQSVLVLGQSAVNLPDKIINKFKYLSDSLKAKPTDTLQNTLSSTEQKIQSNIKHMLEISQQSDELLEMKLGASGNQLINVIKGEYQESVTDFKNKSQTSITLRIALKTRNAIVRAFSLPVPGTFIEKQIVSLEKKEAICKQAIKQDMQELHDDVDSMLARSDCPDELKTLLSGISKEMQSNIDHFNAGKSIDEMPIIFESIEMQGPPDANQSTEKTTTNTKEETAKESAEEKLINEHIQQHSKCGFFKHLWIWLKTPSSTHWNDIE